MSKVIEWLVVCDNCGNKQKYHSHKKEVKGKRRKQCNFCDNSFNAKEKRLKNLPDQKKKIQEELENKGKGFHKYSRS